MCEALGHRSVSGPGYDERVLVADLLNVAESERVAALGGLDARTQSELGQFFTPAAAAQLIASIPRLPESGTLRVLDPGAGSGVLAAALVSRALAERPELSIEVVALDRVHVFDSRSTVFADTGVLQENVVFAGTRGATPGVVEISVSRSHTDDISSRAVAYEEVVFPNDPHRFIRLATNADDTAVADVVLSQPCSLTDLGVQVSTGRVVDFRSRHALSAVEQPDAVPLVYPGNLRDGSVLWPREIRKPQWFRPSDDKDRGMLLPEGWYAVVKRFSAKEERRRIVASVWSPVDNPGEVAFENHLNVFHVGGHGLDKDLAKGIAMWLNSSVIDKFFRTFSGHTQVNATDLRTLRFPTAAALRDLGRNGAASQVEVDFLVMELIAA